MSMTLVYAVCLDVVIQNNFISKYISSYDRFSKPFCHLFRLILRLFWVKTQYNNAWQVRAVRCVWRNSCTRAKCFSRLIIDISLPKLSFDRYNFLVYWDIYSWLMISIFEANYYYCLLKKKTNISVPEVGSKMNNTGLNSRDAILQRTAFKPDNPVEDSCTGREKNSSKQCLPPLTHRQDLCDFPFRASTSCTWLKFASRRIQPE